MKSVNLFSSLVFCFFIMAATSSIAQDNHGTDLIKPKTDRPTTGGTTTPTAGTTQTKPSAGPTVPSAGRPSVRPAGKPASNNKTYTTKSDFTNLLVSNAKAGTIVKYRVEAGGKVEEKEIKVEAGKSTASSSICMENTRELKISYASSDPAARVAFKDMPTCSERGKKAAAKKN